jgi:hypothetical protein
MKRCVFSAKRAKSTAIVLDAQKIPIVSQVVQYASQHSARTSHAWTRQHKSYSRNIINVLPKHFVKSVLKRRMVLK